MIGEPIDVKAATKERLDVSNSRLAGNFMVNVNDGPND